MLFNSILTLVFFLVTGRFTFSSDKVIMIQVVKTTITTFYSILPLSLVASEVDHNFFLILINLSTPLFVPYIYLRVFISNFFQAWKFTEANTGNAIARLSGTYSLIAVFYHSHNIELLVLIRTIGSLIRAIYIGVSSRLGLSLTLRFSKRNVKVEFLKFHSRQQNR